MLAGMSGVMHKTVLVLATCLLLAGCGVRGALQAPKSSASGAPATTTTATAESGQNKPENAAPKPHQGFILDGLLR
jgi:predicted small lipoprotein YifL